MPRSFGAVVLAALLAVGCGATAGTAAPTYAMPSPSGSHVPVVVAAPCSEPAVRAVIDGFVDAFNRGDDPARFFAPAATGQYVQGQQAAGTAFGWYSSSDGLSPAVAIRDRADLAPYFTQRHAAGERWALHLVNYHPNAYPYPRADFGFGLSRTANDLVASKDGPRENAKGMLNCDTRKIVVWTM